MPFMPSVRFDSLEVGQKFYHYDFNCMLEKVCGNAAAKFGKNQGVLFSFHANEMVEVVSDEVKS